MDTRFYTLNTRCTKVSGGADLISFVTAPSESADVAASRPSSGELLDFERCRLRLEQKSLLKQKAEPLPEDPELSAEDSAPTGPAEKALRTPEKRESRWALLADLIASAAILGVSAAAALSFLRLV